MELKLRIDGIITHVVIFMSKIIWVVMGVTTTKELIEFS